MIVTGNNGRRRSIRTTSEDVLSFEDGYALCTPEERSLVHALLSDDHTNDAAKLSLELNDSLYQRPLVPIQQFIEDPYYLGDSMMTLYPALKQDIIDLFAAPYREVVLTGSIGAGKNFLASAAICRILYELSCMKNPQMTFGMSPGTEMVIMLISKNLILAREVMKTSIDDKLKLSPYFMQHFTPKFSTDYTLFPNNIRMTIGSYGAERALGANIFSCMLDECCSKRAKLLLTSSLHDGRPCNMASMSVGDLWAMGPAGRDGFLVEALDHVTGRQTWTPFRMRLSTVQPLVRIEAEANPGSCRAIEPSLEHPVLVRRGDWLVYVPAIEISVGDEVAWRRDDGDVPDDGERAETSRAIWLHADGRYLGGCRAECLRVDDLPSEYRLVRVISTRLLPAEQTYSIETDCKTFVADGCVVHNTNFPPKRTAQQIHQTFGKKLTAANFDIVEKVYRSMLRRIKSRFQIAGGDFPGMVIMVSSAATLDSFTERKLRDARRDPTVFVRDHTAWTSKPRDHFCGKWFYVLCSKSSLRSRILEEGEYNEITQEFLQENNAWMIEVPVEYREDFESNLEDSLRDIAGVSTQAISAFFQRVDAIDACIVDRPHPFSSEVWVAGSPATFTWDTLCRKIERRLPGGFVEAAWAPKESPSHPRWIHIDTSISGDSTGFVMGRIERWVEVVRRDGDGHAYTDTAPYYVIEVLLCIRPPTGDQIYMPDLRRLVYELQAHGFPIHGFSSDSFQAVEMHQQIRRHGIHTELISMDRIIDPYEELKSAIYEKRIEYYGYTPLLQELRSLEYDRVKGKIDHPRHASKDVADALAGVVWGLRQQAARLPWAADADTPIRAVGHEHGWVSDMIPAEDVDLEDVRLTRRTGAAALDIMLPFFIGDD